MQFIKQRQYRQYIATHEIKPVGGKAHPRLKAFGHNQRIMQAHSNDGNNNNAQCYVEIVAVILGLIAGMLVRVLVLVLNDSLRTNFKSVSLSLHVQSLCLALKAWSLVLVYVLEASP